MYEDNDEDQNDQGDDFIERQKHERRSEAISTHLENKGLPALLECTLDPMTTEDFGSGACLYHNSVCVIAYDYEDSLAFGVLHPADEREICPEGEPRPFSVPWDFDPQETAKMIRRLAADANRIYKKLGIFNCEPLVAAFPDSMSIIDDEG